MEDDDAEKEMSYLKTKPEPPPPDDDDDDDDDDDGGGEDPPNGSWESGGT